MYEVDSLSYVFLWSELFYIYIFGFHPFLQYQSKIILKPKPCEYASPNFAKISQNGLKYKYFVNPHLFLTERLRITCS